MCWLYEMYTQTYKTISLLPSAKERISDAPADTKCPLSISLIMPGTHCVDKKIYAVMWSMCVYICVN